jgi:hypothetical protein
MLDTGVVVRPDGTERAIPAGLQYAFQHFWHPVNRQIGAKTFYRRRFTLPVQVSEASTFLTVDDSYTLFVNGVRLAAGRDDLVKRTREFPIPRLLHRGTNVVAIEAANLGASMGVRNWTEVGLEFPTRPGPPSFWECARTAAPGWSLPDVPKGQRWKPPVLLKADEAVRTDIGSTPMWIDRDFGPQEAVYFRMSVDLDGVPIGGDITISADNGYEVWVNGRLMAQYRGEQPDVVAKVDIGGVLRPGRNVIGVKAMNFGGPASLTVLPKIRLAF